ncbi:hypothetical protein D9M71_392540 [compost metagenome]
MVEILVARVFAFGGHVLDHRVHFCPQQQHGRGNIEIQQQYNDRTDAAVHSVVVGERFDVIAKAQRGGDPDHDGEHRAWGNETKLLLHVRHDVVDRRHGHHQQHDDHRPAKYRPQRDNEVFHADLPSQPGHDLWPGDHQPGGDQQHAGNTDRVENRQGETLPDRSPLYYVIGGIHRAHHQAHAGRGGPKGNDDTD